MSRRERTTGRPVLAVAVAALTAAVLALPAGLPSAVAGSVSPTPPKPPKHTVSLYVTHHTDADLCKWGATIAKRQAEEKIDANALLLLHLFAPLKSTRGTGKLGFSRSAGRDQTIPEARLSLQGMATCYYDALPKGRQGEFHLTIGMGTTNVSTYKGVTAKHGKTMARVIHRMKGWAMEQGYASYGPGGKSTGSVDFGGAYDAEPGFGPLPPTKRWVRGFRSFTKWKNSDRPAPLIYYYGSADGCPSMRSPEWKCHWPAKQIAWLAQGNGQSVTIPQVYQPANGGPNASVHAQQWEMLSRRSVNAGYGPIRFVAALSQKQACKDLGGCSSNLNLPPQRSFRDLWRMVNCKFTNPATCKTNAVLRWTADISWRRSYPGAGPGGFSRSASAAAADPGPLDPAGITPAEAGAVPGFDMTTTWIGSGSDGAEYAVWAGSSLDRPGRGGVLIFDAEGPRVFQPAPQAVRDLRIVDASDGVLTLVGQGGQQFTFDVATASYI